MVGVAVNVHKVEKVSAERALAVLVVDMEVRRLNLSLHHK